MRVEQYNNYYANNYHTILNNYYFYYNNLYIYIFLGILAVMRLNAECAERQFLPPSISLSISIPLALSRDDG